MKKIEELFHTFRQIFAGRQLISNENKFRTLSLGAALVHALFCVCMGYMGVYILCVYNIFVVIGYVIIGLVFPRKKLFRPALLLTFVEIELHSSAATLLMGEDWRFMLYTVALVPAAFYFANSITNRNRHFGFSMILAGMVIVCYFAIAVIEPAVEPMYYLEDYHGMKLFISYFNIVLAFGLQLALALLFALESRYMEQLLKKENVKLEEEANVDPLTKLMNRRNLSNCVNEMIDEGSDEVYSVVMIDIDDFKKVNDRYGHSMGDIVLIQLAGIFTDQLRDGDCACRWGGEEFLLLIHGTKEEAYFVSERIRKAVSEKVFVDKRSGRFSVTVTMGIADSRSGKPFRSIVDEADEKLYYGKRDGKNKVVV